MKNKPFIIGEAKHFSPASREWINSVYSFNKSFTKDLPAKYEFTSKLIRSYFFLNENKDLARSRRMRARLLKSNIKKVFVSKPQIKLTNDKVIVTVYTYNNEKRFLSRKIFFYDRKLEAFKLWQKINNLSKPNLGSSVLIKHKNKLKKLLKNNLKWVKLKRRISIKFKNIDLSKSHNNSVYKKFKMNNNIIKKYGIPYNNTKHKDQMYFSLLKLKNISKEISLLHKLFCLRFLRYVLSIFKVKVFIFETDASKRKAKYMSEILNKMNSLVVNNNICFQVDNNIYTINLNLLDKNFYYNRNNELDIINNMLTNRIFVITQFLLNTLEKAGINKGEIKVKFLFNMFANKFLSKFISKYFKDEDTLMSNYNKLMINRFKFSKLLPGLKLLISKIYNKKTELNIIDLKYFQLNTDISMESIALKLKRRYLSWSKILKNFLGSIKLPQFNDRSIISSVNDLASLNLYRSTKINNKHDALQSILNKLYPQILVKEQKTLSNNKGNNLKSGKMNNILNTIRYKWMTGIKIEIAGRLTRRYTASRSLFKYKYKGSLKNINYVTKSQLLNNKVSNTMIRNHEKSNIQYSYVKSNRRIGAFGVKGWMSGY